ncbi:MBL fold metallo-hydrolase [Pseudomonas sp. 5P_3.1_Bac2]|uniref:MBL fold metallo-hydrolase n=1 Tax=Pseudomonas sp. 5P_3.1_Bac2 TaxID=2971617 RepID=UPI0021C6CEEA|nr:MBL fold metallo-hydrolase [Pseudomonas sp. 5P_3.1_Bac2]MCU1718478.1 MBL fold metallo-hydrolase [Pseudomonas sp. 5P_3.1_Bac2]
MGKLYSTKTFQPLALALSLGLSVLPAVTQAAPSTPITQAPGYYRQALGDITITALYDGYVQLKPTQLKGLDNKAIERLLSGKFQQSDPGFQTAVNAYLIQTPEHLLLVDAGAAQCFGPTLGNVQANLKAAGYQPEEVDTVLLTHMHPDHMCGIRSADAQAAFSKATVWAAQADADFWLSAANTSAAPAGAKGLYQMAQDAIAPYKAAGKFRTFKGGEQLAPGLSVLPTPGHTPGHSSFLIESKGQSLLLWGDIIHSHAVQFQHPEVSFEFDSDQAQAIKTRKAVLAEASAKSWWVAGAHLPFPGIGHIGKDGKGYNWVPAEFAPLP